MEFEFDEVQSRRNFAKHGIDFVEVQKLWLDDNALVVPANVVDGEPRFALLGKIEGKCYAAIYTIRGDKVRIISVRRCRKKEERHYEED